MKMFLTSAILFLFLGVHTEASQVLRPYELLLQDWRGPYPTVCLSSDASKQSSKVDAILNANPCLSAKLKEVDQQLDSIPGFGDFRRSFRAAGYLRESASEP